MAYKDADIEMITKLANEPITFNAHANNMVIERWMVVRILKAVEIFRNGKKGNRHGKTQEV